MTLKKLSALALIMTSLLPALSQARDTVLNLDFAAVVQEATQAGKLDGSVKFYLAGATVPGKSTPLGELVTNKKTNAFNKTDEEACSWALQSALITLQDAAKKVGGNAVVDIVSFYKRKESRSSTTYECHAGTFVGGVALKGQAASLK
ncbi:MAG: excinuclease [Pseudomonas sp.]|uniref:excinuclease n=1 Tax=Pseudomonas sp. TaxID=306 RepID=UPI002733E746|nr:excinuclease [Pseudomonas sp.]MDP3847109.1 excinuclease [Pseudomonas sp.]